jgi:ATP-binding cassette subfamily B (MDR/TAP) protein 1
MSNMIEVFYYRNPNKMESKTREYVFIYIGTGLYAVVAYLVQHYFFSIMGENLTTRVRRMMLAGMNPQAALNILLPILASPHKVIT